MSRRIHFRIAAYKAYLAGKTKFNALNKQDVSVDAYLDNAMKAKAKENLETLSAQANKVAEKKVLNPILKEPLPPKDTAYRPKGEPCFIIANGESRKNFDLNKLKGNGYIIGMNVLPIVEDFWPDALVAVDIPTVKYIAERDVPNKLEMWTYPRGGIKDTRIKRIERDWGWSSGPTSCRIALDYKKFQTLYILGMDFFGVTLDGKIADDKGRRLNNMYKGMDRYRKPNSSFTYYGNWLNQMITNTTKNPGVNFYHVVLDGQNSPTKLAKIPNWIDITYDQFEEHLAKMAKKTP